jgi:hypothetical protein
MIVPIDFECHPIVEMCTHANTYPNLLSFDGVLKVFSIRKYCVQGEHHYER